jgi:rifampicin phosphotransferase
MTIYALALTELTRAEAGIGGSKAANLGDLLRAGFPVPAGFVLTTAAFERFLAANALGPDSTPEAIGEAQIPADVDQALRHIAAALGGVSWAVRSSAVAEDLPGASFAGQYETVLGVRGFDALCDAVKQCWASAFSARVVAYRVGRGESAQADRDVLATGPSTAAGVPTPMAVLVQRQVEPDAAGVAFTVNPVTANREVVVSAVRGLGDRLVSGHALADEWVVREPVEGGAPRAVCRATPEQALSEAQVLAVAALARRIEAHFGSPQDVEWALRDGEMFVLQARPITALITPATEATQVAWEAPYPGGWLRNFRFGEWLGDPVTPLFETWLLPVLEQAFWGALRRASDMPTPQPTYVVVHGWYFTSMNFWPRHTVGWLWRLIRHPRLMRVMLQFAPPLVDWALSPWLREWRTDGLPHYRAVVEESEEQVDRLSPNELLRFVERVGAAAGDYFVWIALVAGAGYKTEAPLAQFYRKHLFRELGGSQQHLLAGLADPGLMAAAHAVHSLDWWHPTLGELGLADRARDTSVSREGYSPDRPSLARAVRERAEVEARAALAHHPRRLRQFERLLTTARRYAALREEIVSPFTLGWPVLRRAVQRLGEELVRIGALDSRDDVFFLTQEEVIAALQSRTTESLAERLSQRRQEWEHRRLLVPPLRLGHIPPPLKRGLDQLEAALAPNGAVRNASLRGLPASPGRATGPVRIIRGQAEFGRLRSGEVLVSPTTAPAWTTLFAHAAAVVTDAGGVLAHTSLVAREYGLPAVVGTGNATALLRDGEVVTVDGTTGVVERRA